MTKKIIELKNPPNPKKEMADKKHSKYGDFASEEELNDAIIRLTRMSAGLDRMIAILQKYQK